MESAAKTEGTEKVGWEQKSQAMDFPGTAICIPTKNAGRQFGHLLTALQRQTLRFDHLLIIDSGSTDGTAELARQSGASVHVIPATAFNHGATRNLALQLVNADIYIFLTQDVIPVNDHTLENLIRPFREFPEVGLAYGRQLPRRGAGPIEVFGRFFSYPPDSQLKKKADAPRLGIKTVFCSNACAAYRQQTLAAVGAFPHHVISTEDTYLAAKMLEAGYAIYYAADALVYHSHDYSVIQEFKRYFDLGVFYESREHWIGDSFGRTQRQGWRFFVEGLNYLYHQGCYRSIPEWFIRTLSKFLAYKLGATERRLPNALKYRLSMHKNFWI
ncbi:MAG: glycosyltransferase family 2 protein [Desulfobacteraceae bacterium]